MVDSPDPRLDQLRPEPLQPVLRRIARLSGGRRRARFRAAVAGGAFWIACGVALALVLAEPLRLYPLALAGWLVGGLLLLGLVAATAYALLRPLDRVEIAKRYDDAAGTRDLLSSALGLDPDRLPADSRAFVAAVREEAGRAAERDARVDFASAAPRTLRWTWAPLAAVPILLWVGWAVRGGDIEASTPPVVDDAVVLGEAARLEELLREAPDFAAGALDPADLERLQKLAAELQDLTLTRRDALAEVARIASQLDRRRDELENRELKMREEAARLAKGEDLQDAQRDMDAGRYREAANKVRKKIAELEQKLEEAQRKPDGEVDIEKLRRRLQRLQELLAHLEQLDGLGNGMGLTLDALAVLDRLDGRLGQLREFDGELFDDVELGRAPARPRQPRDQDGQPRRLLAAPSNDAGEGHNEKVLGAERRALTEGKEREVPMAEGEGRSSFGQVRTANDGSRSRTGYQEAVLAAQRAAEDAIYRQDVPASYRRYIRDYFDRLQPDAPPATADSGR